MTPKFEYKVPGADKRSWKRPQGIPELSLDDEDIHDGHFYPLQATTSWTGQTGYETPTRPPRRKNQGFREELSSPIPVVVSDNCTAIESLISQRQSFALK